MLTCPGLKTATVQVALFSLEVKTGPGEVSLLSGANKSLPEEITWTVR